MLSKEGRSLVLQYYPQDVHARNFWTMTSYKGMRPKWGSSKTDCQCATNAGFFVFYESVMEMFGNGAGSV